MQTDSDLLESSGKAAGLVKLAVFFTGLGFSLAVFSLMVAESIVFCLLKLFIGADVLLVV